MLYEVITHQLTPPSQGPEGAPEVFPANGIEGSVHTVTGKLPDPLHEILFPVIDGCGSGLRNNVITSDSIHYAKVYEARSASIPQGLESDMPAIFSE